MSIELRDASFKYRLASGEEIEALAPTSLTVEPGAFVAIVGANGSGKSTLAKLMNGLLFAMSGEVWVESRRIDRRHNDLFARRTVGLVFQNPDNQLVANVVEDDVAFGPGNLGIERSEIRTRVDEALAAVGMAGEARRDPHRLSVGQRQRVAIAGVLAMRPNYLVLDEPTSLLDPRGRQEVLGVVDNLRRRQSIGVVHITHIVEEAVSADSVVVMDKGKVLAVGPPDSLLTDEALMAKASLDVPKANRLARRLREAGLPAPRSPLTSKEVVSALCSSS